MAESKETNEFMTSILTKADTKDIDPNIIHLLCGYIRRFEVLSDSIVPFGITLICLSYYHLEEYFAHANHAKYKITHTTDCNTIEVLGNFYKSSAYGNVLIPSSRGGIYIWTFEMLKRETSMYIGITTQYEQTNQLFYRQAKGHHYALSTTGSLVCKTETKTSQKTTGHASGPSTKSGEIFKMKLDLNNRTLRYEYVRDEWKSRNNFGFDNIPCGMNIHYKMAIRFLNKGSKLALLDFCVK